VTRDQRLLNKTLVVVGTMIVAGVLAATVYALQSSSRPKPVKVTDTSSSSRDSSLPICVEGSSAGCTTLNSQSSPQSPTVPSSSPSPQSTTNTPTTNTTAPRPSTTSPTKSCNSAEGLGLSQLNGDEETAQNNYSETTSTPITTETELSAANSSITLTNNSLDAAYAQYEAFLNAAGCPIVQSAPSHYSLITDPGGLSP
jgi:hypothetical protein